MIHNIGRAVLFIVLTANICNASSIYRPTDEQISHAGGACKTFVAEDLKMIGITVVESKVTGYWQKNGRTVFEISYSTTRTSKGVYFNKICTADWATKRVVIPAGFEQHKWRK